MRISKPVIAHVLVGLTVASIAAVAGSSANLGARVQPEMPDPQEMAKQMEAWLATTKVGPQHEYLKQAVGTFDMTLRTFWGPEPIVTKGKSVRTLEMDGRYVLDRAEFEMMMPDPANMAEMKTRKISGLGITGYDNVRKQYWSIWLDSMGSAPMVMRGSLDQTGKVMSMFGQMDEPMTGEIGKTVKSVSTMPSPTSEKFEMWEVQYGDPFKVFEIEYSKR